MKKSDTKYKYIAQILLQILSQLITIVKTSFDIDLKTRKINIERYENKKTSFFTYKKKIPQFTT